MHADLGKIAYDAYVESVGGKSVRGEPLPTWEEQLESKPEVARAWKAAAIAVVDELTRLK